MERAVPPVIVDAPDPTPSADRPVVSRPRTLWRGRRIGWVAVGLLVCALIGLALWRVSTSGPTPLTRADVDGAVKRGIAQAQQDQRNAPPDAARAYRQILPSLVTVIAGPAGKTELGAGVVINADGSVLTAFHVVQAGGPIQIGFADGTKAAAIVAKQQPDADIAVLSVDRLPQVVVPAVMGGVSAIGQPVFAVGNPLGLQASLSAGVVSGLDRTISTGAGQTLTGLIQFDAAVNPGNSGGPLLNRDGQVIGVVTGLANPAKQPYFVGIGFAVPIATAGGVAGGPAQ
jgi:S1-C subfamily serine protease